eukprot:CAMPEP_0202701190 /NCGR_PEP_ID=MMETSP1385-20130828/14293_1 /ASSEMBLY_ACC=CAM_ASM_000861 /TAXON_ID=933848 /ORGANISM="Elphidium margaritaceum" /LENGTH=340 /DNA_ID=CAMNT_0049358549 /DNA_START=53 /DNA_END=1071 /DNA_ORIENTATION=-
MGASIVVSLAQDANNAKKIEICNNRNAAKSRLVHSSNRLQDELNHLQRECKEIEQERSELDSKIQDEEKAMSTFRHVRNDETVKFLVAIGSSGDGKSTVLNRLEGDLSKWGDNGSFESGDSDQSVTTKLFHKECTIRSVSSVLVDTPGYNDTKKRDNLHFNNLATYLYGCGGVDAFLLVVNGTKIRFDRNLQDMLQCYDRFFGAMFWNHLIIVLVRIEGVEKEKYDNTNRGEKLKQNLNETFGLDDTCNVPIIPIGYDADFTAFCGQVMDAAIEIANHNSKLSCGAIKSPIKKHRTKRRALMNRISQLNDKIRDRQGRYQEVSNQIRIIDDKLNNPEKLP